MLDLSKASTPYVRSEEKRTQVRAMIMGCSLLGGSTRSFDRLTPHVSAVLDRGADRSSSVTRDDPVENSPTCRLR